MYRLFHARCWPALLGLWLSLTLTGQAQATLLDTPTGQVYTLAVGSDGTRYLGGTFSGAGAQTGGGALLSTADGLASRDFPLIAGSVLGQGTVNAVVSDGNGGWYIGGNFASVGGVSRSNVAQIDSTGAVTTWNPGANGPVKAIAYDSANSKIYIGGDFTQVGSTTRNHLAAIGTNGSLTSWDPSVTGGSVTAIALNGSSVYIGGGFTTVGGSTSRTNAAAIDSTTANATGWNPSPNGLVNALVIISGSPAMVYMGGDFTSVKNAAGTITTRNRVAAIGTDGSVGTWNPVANNSVKALATDGSTVYIGGSFTTICGTGASCFSASAKVRNRLAAVNVAGNTLSPWNPSANNTVYSISLSATQVYVGGGFTTLNPGTSVTRNYLAALSIAGLDAGTVSSWNPNPSSNVLALAVSGSSVYAGGSFRWMGVASRNNLAAVDSTGRLTNWNPQTNSGGTVRKLVISGSTLYAGGDFTSIGATPVTRNRLAAIGTDGTLASWDPNANNFVNALAVSGSTVYAGGNFTTVGGSTRNYLAAIGTDGTLSTTWNPNANNFVNALAVSGSTVYAGGAFTTIGGTARNRLAAIGTDGTLASWNPNANNFVNALAVSGSTVYLGGNFTTVGGTSRNRLAAVGTNGTLSVWNPNAADTVNTLVVNGSTVYAGGTFNYISNNLKASSPVQNLSYLDLALIAPDAPTGLTATPGNAQASISFTAGSDSGSVITNYQYSTDGINYTAFSPAQTTSPVTITGLTNGTSYNIQLRAINASGAGLASAAVSVTPYTTPGTPTITGITPGNGQLSVAFTAGSTGGSAITNYQYSTNGGTSFTAFSPAQTTSPVTITGLTNGTAYDVQLKAVNAAGTGAATASTAGTPYTTPSAPTGLSASASYGSATVSFTPGADGGSAITNYQYSTDGVTYTAFSPPQTTSPVTVSGLTAGTAYTLSLKAVNAGGVSAASSVSNSVTPYTTPAAPTALLGTPGDARVVLDYTAGATGGNAITNYQVSTNGGSSFTALSPEQTGNPLTITGLTNGTTYSIAIKAVNAGGAGTASGTVSVTPNGPCGPGVGVTTSPTALWQMLALPCVPNASPASAVSLFGDGTPSGLATGKYAAPAVGGVGQGWIIESRDVGITPHYVVLGSGDSLFTDTGYWFKTYVAPTGNQLSLTAGTTSPALVTQAQGCAAVNGCRAITVTTVANSTNVGVNRYNLVGNPYAYPVDWSRVRVRIDGSYATLTPAQAAGVATGGDAALNLATPVISNQVWIWNGTSYDTFTDQYPTQGNLQYFKSFWINVLPGAFGHTIELLIPAELTTLPLSQLGPSGLAPANVPALASTVTSTDLPWYLGWLDWVAPAAQAAPTPVVSGDWVVKISADNHVTGWHDHSQMLGQLGDAQITRDAHDLPDLAPFGSTYLDLAFPHADWLEKPGDYATDFRPATGRQPADWNFELRTSQSGGIVFLSWQGDPAVLKRCRLIDLQTGQTITPSAAKWLKKGYPVTITSPIQRYTWRYLGH